MEKKQYDNEAKIYYSVNNYYKANGTRDMENTKGTDYRVFLKN